MKRIFAIMTEPHPGDPAHLIPVADVTDNTAVRQYSNTDALQKVVDDLRHTISYNEGRRAGAKEVLDGLGMTFEAYLKVKK